MEPTELIRLSIAIENQIDASGDLRPIPGKASTLFSISRHRTGYARFVRYDVPADIRRRLDALDPDAALRDHETVCRILAEHAPCDSVFAGNGHHFAHPPTPSAFPDVVFRDGCYVVFVGEEPVSWAWTADQSEQAAELAVETDQRYRRRGYARQVAAAWAHHVLKAGRVAFYSHEIGNRASEALAHSLGVVQYAVVTTYESKSAAG